MEEPHVCSSASKRSTFRQEVKVGPLSTRSVPFIIIPMKEGEFRVEVKAAVKDSSLNDGVVKVLRVVVRKSHTLLTPSEYAIILWLHTRQEFLLKLSFRCFFFYIYNCICTHQTSLLTLSKNVVLTDYKLFFFSLQVC